MLRDTQWLENEYVQAYIHSTESEREMRGPRRIHRSLSQSTWSSNIFLEKKKS